MDDAFHFRTSLPNGLRKFAVCLVHRSRKRFALISKTWHCVRMADAIINL